MQRKAYLLSAAALCAALYASAVNQKIDPAFYAYFADSSVIIRTDAVKGSFIADVSQKGGTENILMFDSPFETDAYDRIGVIVKTDGSAPPALIEEQARINDSIYTGFAQYADIEAAASYSRVKRIYLSKPMFQSSDSALFFTEMNGMHNEGFTGKGTLLGYIDDGIPSGADFLFEDGISRFVSLWGQKNSRLSPPSGFSYGEEISGPYLSTFMTGDMTGHAASILSVILSKNIQSAAPDAEIIGVDALPTTKSVMDGIKYVCSAAEKAGKPMALLLPMNHFWGTHRGDEPLEQVINDLFAPWRSARGISVPAGNLGARYIHFKCSLSEFDTSSALFESPFVVFKGFEGRSADLDMLPEGDFLFRVFFSADGEIRSTDWINPKNKLIGRIDEGGFSFRYAYSGIFSQMHICMDFPSDMIVGISFRYLSGGCAIDGYCAQGGYFLSEYPSESFIPGDKNNTIAPPGLAKQAITSGAYVSRTRVPGIVSVDTLFSIPDWNAKSHLNYIKPDVYAPGKYIYAYSLYQLPDRYMVSENLGVFYSSSFSAAFTAGAMLLLLQTDIFMSNDRLNSLIRRGVTNIPYDPSSSYNPIGYGFLNVFNSYLSTTVGTSSGNLVRERENGGLVIYFDGGIRRVSKAFKLDGGSIKELKTVAGKAYDASLSEGPNIYRVHYTSPAGEGVIETEYLNREIKSIQTEALCYDLAGRAVNSKTLKAGVYFMKKGKESKRIVILK